MSAQNDRNLVIFNRKEEMVWYSSGKPRSQGICGGNSMRASIVLDQYDHLISLNKKYKAIMEDNGNFALYCVDDNTCLWSSDTTQPIEKGPYRLEITKRGCMQIKCRDAVVKEIRWEVSEECSTQPPLTLTLKDDGRLVASEEGKLGRRVWCQGGHCPEYWSRGPNLMCTGSSPAIMRQGDMLESPNKLYRFKIEPQGKAVLYEVTNGLNERALHWVGEYWLIGVSVTDYVESLDLIVISFLLYMQKEVALISRFIWSCALMAGLN